MLSADFDPSTITYRPIITDAALESLNESAIKLQAMLEDRHGEVWETIDINEALSKWLEVAIETMCDDAAHYSHAIESSFFERQIKSRPSIPVPQAA